MQEQLTDLLFSNDFDAYRVSEIERGAFFIRELLKGSQSPDYVRGAMEMLRKIIHLPLDMAKTQEQKDVARILIDRILSLYEAKTVRKYLEMDGE